MMMGRDGEIWIEMTWDYGGAAENLAFTGFLWPHSFSSWLSYSFARCDITANISFRRLSRWMKDVCAKEEQFMQSKVAYPCHPTLYPSFKLICVVNHQARHRPRAYLPHFCRFFLLVRVVLGALPGSRYFHLDAHSSDNKMRGGFQFGLHFVVPGVW